MNDFDKGTRVQSGPGYSSAFLHSLRCFSVCGFGLSKSSLTVLKAA